MNDEPGTQSENHDKKPALARGSRQYKLAYATSLRLVGRLLLVALEFLLLLLVICLVPIGVGVLWAMPVVGLIRQQAVAIAALHRERTGVIITVPVLPPAPNKRTGSNHFLDELFYLIALRKNRSFWQLMCWAILDPYVGIILAAAPLLLIARFVEGAIVLPILNLGFGVPIESIWFEFIPLGEPLGMAFAALLAVGYLCLGIFAAPWFVRVHGHWASLLLNTQAEEIITDLRERVAALSESRTEATADAAAELRRIERDVHDGAQAQLVALGLKLGTAELLMKNDPQKALALIAEARDDSSATLLELRSLMRGIHPPILADRGLAAALEAIALEAGSAVSTTIDLPHSVDPAIETAAYFAVREVVTNAIKHADATMIVIDARIPVPAENGHGTLVLSVFDNGRGGITPLPGHGITGIRRRLDPFDGTVDITSPKGGPSTVRIEIPCELLLPKTT